MSSFTSKQMIFFWLLVIFGILTAIGAIYFIIDITSTINNQENESINAQQNNNEEILDIKPNKAVEIIIEDLDTPWDLAFLSENEFLITERPGKIIKVNKNQKQALELDEKVEMIGEGGLLGLVLHPKFNENNWIYVYFTTRVGEKLINKVNRYEFNKSGFFNKKTIIDNIPAGGNHNGGRLYFSPDGFLYVTTGDAGVSSFAQDKNSLAGKILRVKEDGGVPEDNPFKNQVWSYGHRNVQGIAWDNNKNMWATEHGPSGASSGYDEINFIEKGKNYGWPDIKGSETRKDMITPKINSGSKETWAPSEIIYLDGELIFVGLRGSAIFRAKILSNNKINLVEPFLKDEYGRIRILKINNGMLYIGTSNRDGRGIPKDGDDKIIRIDPKNLFKVGNQEDLLLPDLIIDPESKMKIRVNSATKDKTFYFSTTVANIGDGDLEILGQEDQDKNLLAKQILFNKSGERKEEIIGRFVFSDLHKHWHFEDFIETGMYTYKIDGSLDKQIATTGKRTFCLYDVIRSPIKIEKITPRKKYLYCTNKVQGISVGWADVYTEDLIDQRLNVGDLKDGNYAVATIIDPYNLIKEKDETNNKIILYVEVKGNKVSLISKN